MGGQAGEWLGVIMANPIVVVGGRRLSFLNQRETKTSGSIQSGWTPPKDGLARRTLARWLGLPCLPRRVSLGQGTVGVRASEKGLASRALLGTHRLTTRKGQVIQPKGQRWGEG